MAPIVAFLPLILAGVSAAVTGVEMANQPSAPKAPTQATSNTQRAEAQQAAALAQAQALTRRKGMAATTLTSPMGVTSGPAQSQTATLGT